VLFAVHPMLVRQASAASDLSLATTLLVVVAYAFVSIRGVAGAEKAGVLAGGVAILIAARRTTLVLPFVATAVPLIAPLSCGLTWRPVPRGPRAAE
jgi:hypothetical protein